ncbi:hypothetical protein [Burkholderia sp. SRS-W-2-2016]|uniref:hypothetical protein n=1 Tax=Burkholderia sp. SRS-W-2-2016 TaxID=1926878 RepID=UPI00117DDA05|nr:hypothetical protein [Burkholderia sp. SRS-W-2-2016]
MKLLSLPTFFAAAKRINGRKATPTLVFSEICHLYPRHHPHRYFSNYRFATDFLKFAGDDGGPRPTFGYVHASRSPPRAGFWPCRVCFVAAFGRVLRGRNVRALDAPFVSVEQLAATDLQQVANRAAGATRGGFQLREQWIGDRDRDAASAWLAFTGWHESSFA